MHTIENNSESVVEAGMQTYKVSWLETNTASCTVRAHSLTEAVEIVARGDHIGESEDIDTFWYGDVHADSIKAELVDEEE